MNYNYLKILDKKSYMNKLNEKHKIIIIISTIMVIGLGYYVYSKENSKNEMSDLQVEEGNIENNQSIKEEKKIKVHISGAIKNEGVFELDENSRIIDVIQQAGGLTEQSYTKYINLAEMLEDGSKIYIPTKEEIENQEKQNEEQENKKDIETFKNTITINQNENNQKYKSTNQKIKKININTATQEELDSLPGVGASTANKILNYRKENGKFKTKEDIKNVSGIGESKFNKIKDLIEV